MRNSATLSENKYKLCKSSKRLTICFWNINGLKNIYNLDCAQVSLLIKNEIICLAETWCTQDRVSLPAFLCSYSSYVSPAVKDKSRGRASGDLITLIKNNCFTEHCLINKSNLWLFIRIKNKNNSYIIGNVYWPPAVDDNFCVNSLQEFIAGLMESDSHGAKMIVAGDFNARVGCLNGFVDEIFDCSVLNEYRSSLDVKITRRGRLLTVAMESLGFVLCSGRAPSDCPSNFTYVSKNGHSVIDLFWLEIDILGLVHDLHVTSISECSDHFLVYIELEDSMYLNGTQTFDHIPRETIRWDDRGMHDYCMHLLNSRLLYFDSEDVEYLLNNFKIAIVDSARKVGMVSVNCVDVTRAKFKAKKPWFNLECKKTKNRVNRSYKKF